MIGKTLAALALLGLGSVQAATNATLPPAELVDFDDTGVVGGLHRPATAGPKSKIAVYVMHAEQDYLSFSACTELAKRGYTVFCANNAVSKTGIMTDLEFEGMMIDAGKGMSFLRNQTDIDQIVIFGHSGGGATMSAYQNIAENGVSACNGAEKLRPCTNNLTNLEPADGFLFVDTNYGISTMTLLSVNPAIMNESSGKEINETLNLYSPANGWTSSGANYSASFTKLFQSGVATRWNRIIDHALERRKLLDEGKGLYYDDEPLTIPDAMYVGYNNKFFSQDKRFLAHTVNEWPLLHKDGSNTTQVVHSVRPSYPFTSIANEFTEGAVKTTVNRFLETLAVRVDEDFGYNATSFHGIQYNTSQTAPEANVPGIKVPSLWMGMTGHWEYLNAEKLYLASGASDKSIAFVEGASHTLDVCTECEAYPGQYGDTEKTAYDHMDWWLSGSGRFL